MSQKNQKGKRAFLLTSPLERIKMLFDELSRYFSNSRRLLLFFLVREHFTTSFEATIVKLI
jgi:hypothetical protein